jgi:hypothetical protein
MRSVRAILGSFFGVAVGKKDSAFTEWEETGS